MDDLKNLNHQITALSQRVDTHVEEYHARMLAEERKMEELLTCQTRTARAIETLAASQLAQSEQTKGLLDAWDNAQSVLKVGSLLGQFAKWIASLAIIGAAWTWLINHSDKVG